MKSERMMGLTGEDGGESGVPGLGWWENVRFHLAFLRDQKTAYTEVMERHGPVVRMRLGPYWLYAVAEPEMIEEILVGKAEKFRKDVGMKDIAVFVGQGLLVSDGELWRRQRKLVAPSLQRRQIEAYAETMVAEAERMVGGWEDGETLDLHLEVTSMTLRIVVKALFGLEMDEAIEAISSASDDVMEYIEEMRHSPWRFVPDPIPSPKQRDFEGAKARFDEIVYGLIEERRAGGEGEDLLYRLLQATGEEGEGMSDEQLRDEVLTLFMAGHETTSLSITYAWYLLSKRPACEARLREEAQRVLGGEQPGVEHVAELAYAEAVFKESMRMYPPAWAVGREPLEDVEIGGVTIPKGAQVMLPQFWVHRDERWYDEPDTFRPERWLAEEGEEAPAEDRPRMAYFPFGGGPRICAGNHFARMEAVLALAIMARDWSFDLVGPEELETYTSVTQRPVEKVEMRVRGG